MKQDYTRGLMEKMAQAALRRLARMGLVQPGTIRRARKAGVLPPTSYFAEGLQRGNRVLAEKNDLMIPGPGLAPSTGAGVLSGLKGRFFRLEPVRKFMQTLAYGQPLSVPVLTTPEKALRPMLDYTGRSRMTSAMKYEAAPLLTRHELNEAIMARRKMDKFTQNLPAFSWRHPIDSIKNRARYGAKQVPKLFRPDVASHAGGVLKREGADVGLLDPALKNVFSELRRGEVASASPGAVDMARLPMHYMPPPPKWPDSSVRNNFDPEDYVRKSLDSRKQALKDFYASKVYPSTLAGVHSWAKIDPRAAPHAAKLDSRLRQMGLWKPSQSPGDPDLSLDYTPLDKGKVMEEYNRIFRPGAKQAAYEQGFMDKLAQAGLASEVMANRTPFQLARLAAMLGVGYGGGAATGLWNPGDPEHRGFSANIQGLGAGLGAMGGGTVGYGIADRLEQAALAAKGGKQGLTAAAAKIILPFITGTAGATLGGYAGHAGAAARYEGNTVWDKVTGQPTYEDRRRERVKNMLKALAVTGGLAGAGYGAYAGYEALADNKQ